jgi:cell division protease FtsH
METIQNKISGFKGPQTQLLLVIVLLSTVFFLWQLYTTPSGPERFPISYTQFMEQLNASNVKTVSIQKLRVNGELAKKTELTLTGSKKPISIQYFVTYLPTFQGQDLLNLLSEKKAAVTVEPPDEGSPFWGFVLSMLPWVLIIGFWFYMMRRAQQQVQGGAGGLFTFGQSKAKLYDVKRPKVTFADVAGLDNVKQELRESIEFLKSSEKYAKIGAKVPKGVLLIGPPGTGKTLLARASAGEAGVPFYSISASEFIEMFVGVGASRVRDMFKKARASHPSIIFIDEIDAVGRTRGAGFGGGHDEREQTLNQLLSEMDGFDPNEEVIVMAATNRPDVLDPALLRPGRFDKHIVVDRPGWKERKAILGIHVKNKMLAGDVDLETIARGTPGMTGADLENLTNQAALTALRRNEDIVHMRDFEEARDTILMGTVREETITDTEKKITAYHEAGHALVARELPGTDPIYKVSIIPRGMAMGVTQLLPEEDRHYYPRAYLLNKLCVALGGRGAEKLVFNDMSSGAQSDLKEATSLAEKMVAQWGMSDKVGPMNLGRGEEHPFLGRELAQPKRYSDEMAWIMDQEIQRLLHEAESKAMDILSKNRHVLDPLATALLKEEILDKAQIDRIIAEANAARAR